MKKLLVIDTHSLIHRAYHAMPPLTTPDGRPIQAVYGMARLILAILRTGPDYVIAAGDAPGRTFRKELDEAYKAHRAPMPDDLREQLVESKELFGRFGVPLLELSGYEADDIIATIVTHLKDEPDLQIEILSSDSDLLQLVDDGRVVERALKSGITDTTVLDREGVIKKFNVTPEQIPDYKALVGDTSDNIPGVAGIGPKSAATLLAAYTGVEDILSHLEEIPKFAAKLPDNGEQLRASLVLATLLHDVPVEIPSMETMSVSELDRRGLRDYFYEVGFQSLAAQLMPRDPLARPIKKAAAKKAAPTLPSSFERTEIKAGGTAEPVIELDAYLDDNGIRKSNEIVAGYELKEALQQLWIQNLDLTPPYDDLGIMAYLLYPDLKSYGEEMVRSLVKDGADMGTAELRHQLIAALEREKEYGIYKDLELPVLRLLAEIEMRGIQVDRNALLSLSEEINGTIEELEKKIHELAGEPFNLNSPKQVGDVLFRKLNLKVAGKKKESTKAEVLEELVDQHEIVPLMLQYRENFKVKSGFVEPILERIDDGDTLRTEYVQTGAATGRLSSRNPNMQNIPQGSRWSQALRDCFMARDGYQLVSFDYSQLELRIVASLSGDPAMTNAFMKGEDVHTATASIVLGKPVETITKDERRIAKTLNFGLVYGMGATAFGKASGMKRTEAKAFIDRYFERFAAIKQWQESILASARKTGYTETKTGRRRYFPALTAGGPSWMTSETERAAINHPVQGLDADIAKLAMLQVREITGDGEDARILLTIHDELLLEVKTGSMKTLVPRLRAAMEGVMPELGIPLAVDVRAGVRWGSLDHLSR
jgi:DNA polymerase-1